MTKKTTSPGLKGISPDKAFLDEAKPEKPGLPKPLVKKLAESRAAKKKALKSSIASKAQPRITKSKKAVLEASLPETPEEKEIPLPDKEDVGELLSPRQEAFVRNYVVNDRLRGNGTLSYADAYGFDLNSMSTDDGDFDDEIGSWRVKSSYRKAYEGCSSCASVLLRNLKVQARIQEMYASMLTAALIDSRLTKVILNGQDQHAVQAAREANRVLGRGSDTVKHEGLPPSAPPIVLIEVVTPAHADTATPNAG